MKNLTKYVTLAALALASSAVFADDKVVLESHYPVGANYALRLSGTVSIQGSDANLTGLINVKVISDKDGVITSQQNSSQMSININGQDMQIPQGPDRFEESNAQGAILKIKGDGVQPTEYQSAYLTQIVFSKDAVGVGDTWTYTYPANSTLQIAKTTNTYKILSIKTVDGVKCFEVQVDDESTVDSQAASVKGTAYIDMANGQMVKFSQVWTNVPTAGSPMPVSGTFTIEKVLSSTKSSGGN